MANSDKGRIVAGKYELCEPAGEGGMAVVWKGEMHGAAGFRRTVAIKKMKSNLRDVKNYVDMFVEEARVGSEMRHSNIVQVLDFLQDEERDYYLIMEWVEGVDLLEFLKAFRGSGQILPWGLVAIVGIGALRGLAAAHERVDKQGKAAPIIHRDISPQNLLLSTRGEVKITDFGLALAGDRLMSLTDPGMVKGKLSYLSPEIIRGKPVSPQTDIFALGTMLWEALAGKSLFSGEDDLEVFRKVRDAEILPLHDERPGLPQELVDIINKALAKDPDDRFESARSFAHALSNILGGAKMAGDAQLLLGRAVRAARTWLGKNETGAAPDKEQAAVIDEESKAPSWEEIEVQFSSISALPSLQESEAMIDIWFSKSDIKVS